MLILHFVLQVYKCKQALLVIDVHVNLKSIFIDHNMHSLCMARYRMLSSVQCR